MDFRFVADRLLNELGCEATITWNKSMFVTIKQVTLKSMHAQQIHGIPPKRNKSRKIYCK